ncbi:hypothetical protein BD309DRAFT_268417 [Dichomitus squalens]|uniref:Uncharacterized protein n=1 Tax=Dichomitus squalens TaxID=114155 RepID=A0A4Q9NJL7_9APHY|nr:hypothetical protein BD309DRAFT_268417 [Dichomitus squalens]TBU55472.1 hypothetical protein BD310DRAFT_685676 [Dichomitus squalens]
MITALCQGENDRLGCFSSGAVTMCALANLALILSSTTDCDIWTTYSSSTFMLIFTTGKGLWLEPGYTFGIVMPRSASVAVRTGLCIFLCFQWTAMLRCAEVSPTYPQGFDSRVLPAVPVVCQFVQVVFQTLGPCLGLYQGFHIRMFPGLLRRARPPCYSYLHFTGCCALGVDRGKNPQPSIS